MSLLTEWKGHIEKYIGLWIIQDGKTPERNIQNNRMPICVLQVKPDLIHDQSKSHIYHTNTYLSTPRVQKSGDV